MKRVWLRGLAICAIPFVSILSSTPVNASPSGVEREAVLLEGISPEDESQAALFPEPAEIRPNVRFWLDVYTMFDERHAIIHDNVNLDVRYETIDMNERWPNATRRYATRQVTLRKRTIAEALKRLGARDGQCETELECGIVKMFKYSTDGDRYYAAARQIRVQYGLSSRFLKGLAVSGQYMDEMRRIFDRHGVPLDLLALPHVESSFNVQAYSRVGAAGIWQFMRSTGRSFMKINNEVDERRDPLMATEAAARFLKRNYEDIGSWPLVVTSYNHGKNGMLRAKAAHGSDIAAIIRNYDGPAFGFASRNFYCEFLAARKIMADPEKYFGKVDFKSPLKFDMVKLDGHMRADKLGRHFDLQKIAQLNPALHKNILRGNRHIPKGYVLRLPEGTAERVEQVAFSVEAPKTSVFDEAPIAPSARKSRRPSAPAPAVAGDSAKGFHLVQSGESLYLIAQRHGITVAELRELNGLTRRGWIYPGQKLAVPQNDTPQKTAPVQPVAVEPAVALASATPPPARDGLMAGLARWLGSLADWKNEVPARPVVVQAVPAEPAPILLPSTTDRFRFVKTENGAGVISVLPEETFELYAEWAGVPLKELYRLNRIRQGRSARLWQTVRVPLAGTTAQIFEHRRLEYHQVMYREFAAAHTVKNVDNLVLKKGESAKTLAGKGGVPLWLLTVYNDGKKLDGLRAGEVLRVPVVEKKAS